MNNDLLNMITTRGPEPQRISSNPSSFPSLKHSGDDDGVDDILNSRPRSLEDDKHSTANYFTDGTESATADGASCPLPM